MSLSISVLPPDARVRAIDLARHRAARLLADLALLAEPPRLCGAIHDDTIRLYVHSPLWPDDTGLTLLLRSYGDPTTVAVWTIQLVEQGAPLVCGSALKQLLTPLKEAARG